MVAFNGRMNRPSVAGSHERFFALLPCRSGAPVGVSGPCESVQRCSFLYDDINIFIIYNV